MVLMNLWLWWQFLELGEQLPTYFYLIETSTLLGYGTVLHYLSSIVVIHNAIYVSNELNYLWLQCFLVVNLQN